MNGTPLSGKPVDSVPTCATGPSGRFTFVIRELAAAVRRRQARRRAAPEIGRNDGPGTAARKDERP